MNRSLSRTLLAAVAGTLILSGCETTAPQVIKPVPVAPKPVPAPQPRPAPGTPGNPVVPTAPQAGSEQSLLKEGIELYNKGAYGEAIKRLAAPEIAAGSKAGQVEALKYTAFSYCLTSRQTLCRQSFEKAFKLDPSFNLQAGEHGHPLWTPMFQRAKKARQAKPAK
jgi:hypothetical protein